MLLELFCIWSSKMASCLLQYLPIYNNYSYLDFSVVNFLFKERERKREREVSGFKFCLNVRRENERRHFITLDVISA